MGISLAYLKKVLKFGIVLGCISFVDLRAYTPSLKRYHFWNINSLPISIGGLWLSELVYLYHSYNGGTWNYTDLQNLVKQSIVPSAMVDTKGSLYTVNFERIESTNGARFLIGADTIEDYVETIIYPWKLIANETITINTSVDYYKLEKENNYTAEDDFMNYMHNAFQPCIAQEIGGYSEYLYVFFYIPPTYFMEISRYKDSQEGILKIKISKSDLSIASYELLKGGYDENTPWSFRHLYPRTLPGFVFGPQWGNFQAWANGDNDVNLLWLCTLDKNNPNSIAIGRWSSNLSPEAFCLGVPKTGTSICSRFINLNGWIFGINSWAGYRILLGYQKNQIHPTLRDDIPNYLAHNQIGDYTPRHYDFCIIDGHFCILGLSPTSQTDNTKTSLSGERWTSKYINEPSKIVLMLSTLGGYNDYYEDPQNIIYSTGQTSFTTQSCSVDCGCHRLDDSTYHPEQLFKNTHKLVTYTSESGSKYIIYCYCYPGKSKQLFLGYAPYIISNNKVQLLTKTEFKTPPSTDYPMGESFGNFTSCSRIISMDCKNGQLWITWIDKNEANYFCFHIAAKDLVGE